MNLLEKLDYLMKDQGLNKRKLAIASGVPYTTIDGLYKKGYENTQLSTIRKLAKALGVSVDYLIGDPIAKAPAFSAEALKIAKSFDALDEWGKQVVSDIVRDETARIDAQRLETEPKKTIPLMENRLAAGYADPDFGNVTSEYEIPASVHADFAIHVHGTSMEPYLHDGDIALGVNRKPKHGEIGAFLLNGEYLVKQYITDHLGNVYLLSLNRQEADKDIYLMKDNRDYFELWTFGAIITDKKIPLPKV